MDREEGGIRIGSANPEEEEQGDELNLIFKTLTWQFLKGFHDFVIKRKSSEILKELYMFRITDFHHKSCTFITIHIEHEYNYHRKLFIKAFLQVVVLKEES